ncbi:glutaredoxin family protein [Brevibacillus fluminis]|uniref:Glutaredoxin family protein n=1 Tax=Brevibacillus fluminis TaxID=511487 RepID=A0A3M8DIQ7_9BACL|nr:glutaredoxin family protein [Brevibacillus fluminis]RNB87255.1 glutaredoxin family protein [Brevibacillus fluminis]
MTAIVYTSSTCTYCKQVKTFLESQCIAFEERNIDENQAYFDELSRMGMMSVPVTVIGSKQVLGFNPARIQKLVAEAQVQQA